VTLKAVLFDLDNTLVPEMANYELAFASACRDAARRYSFDLETFRAAVFRSADELWRRSETFEFCSTLGIGSPTSLLSDFPGDRPEFARLRDWAPRYRERCWTGALRAVVNAGYVVGLAAELDEAFRTHLRSHCPPYEDVLRTLQRVSGSYALAVLTNGPGDVQRAKLHASGLDSFFPVTVASGDIGFGKPDPRIFTTALERLGVRVEEAIAIGDSLERDVGGAHDAGLRCIWLNPDRHARSETVNPDHTIQSLDELGAVVQGLTARRGGS
jgi:putative hydrolase of the HAD superfamily